jgi:hypothetical protein
MGKVVSAVEPVGSIFFGPDPEPEPEQDPDPDLID